MKLIFHIVLSLSLSFFITLSLPLYHSLSLPLSHSLSHSLFITLSLPPSFSLSLSLSLHLSLSLWPVCVQYWFWKQSINAQICGLMNTRIIKGEETNMYKTCLRKRKLELSHLWFLIKNFGNDTTSLCVFTALLYDSWYTGSQTD